MLRKNDLLTVSEQSHVGAKMTAAHLCMCFGDRFNFKHAETPHISLELQK